LRKEDEKTMQIVLKILLFAVACYGLCKFGENCVWLIHHAAFFGFTADDLGAVFSTHPGAQIAREALAPFFAQIVVQFTSASVCIWLALRGKPLDRFSRVPLER